MPSPSFFISPSDIHALRKVNPSCHCIVTAHRSRQRLRQGGRASARTGSLRIPSIRSVDTTAYHGNIVGSPELIATDARGMVR